MNFNTRLGQSPIQVSVPCRVDLGGTLDISTFYLFMASLSPASFNIALDLRTRVTLSSFEKGYVKVSSKGFETAVFKKDEAPFHPPLGLMFALAKYFDAEGATSTSTRPPHRKAPLAGLLQRLWRLWRRFTVSWAKKSILPVWPGRPTILKPVWPGFPAVCRTNWPQPMAA